MKVPISISRTMDTAVANAINVIMSSQPPDSDSDYKPSEEEIDLSHSEAECGVIPPDCGPPVCKAKKKRKIYPRMPPHLKAARCKICRAHVNPQRKVCSRHKIVKDGVAVFKCSVCSESYSTEDEYIEHSNECRTTICQICGYKPTLGRKSSEGNLFGKMQRHMLVHAKEKPFICDTCGRGFTQLNNLKGHLRQHTGEKPFICEHCGLSFTHNVSLRKHFCGTLGRRVEPLDFKNEGVGRRKQ